MARSRVGVVGTGYWAKAIHAPTLAVHPEADFVGVYGRDPAKGAAIAAANGVRAFASFDEMLAEVDIVSIAVPPTVQCDYALPAARAGKHLLLEKPLSIDSASALELADAADEHSVSSVVFFTGRYLPEWESWLDQAIASQPLCARGEWFVALVGPAEVYVSPWRTDYGALWDLGAHMLSFILPALGPVKSVAGLRGSGDLVHLILSHEAGGSSTISVSETLPVEADRLTADLCTTSGWTSRPKGGLSTADSQRAYGNALSELISNMTSGERRHRCDVHFGRAVVDVLVRCEEQLADSRST